MLTRPRSQISWQLAWWMVGLLGVACVVLGVVLLAEPFRALSVLHWLVVAALILTGVSELLSAEVSPRPWLWRIVGVAWIVVGVLAASWPGITILALAVAVGIGLLLGGLLKVAAAIFGESDERWILGISGLTNVVVGVLALSWPAVTVLVLAVIFGVRTALFGISQIAWALKLRGAPAGSLLAGEADVDQSRWPRPLRLVGTVLALALALGGVAISVAIHRAEPNQPGPFYTAPSPLPDGPPGTILRTEVIDDYYAGATTYRVLYKSTGYDNKPTAVSGILVVPDGPAPAEGRKVLAYAHGTVGVASNCAPSLRKASEIPLTLEGGQMFVAAGYVIAATDYQGLGTRGPHPYLVGDAEGMNALDSVRAAHNLPQAHAGTVFAVWGHSQGGHASLFTGQLAATYAPELRLVGVAAGGPVPNLIDLFKVNIKTTVGRVLIAMALQSWAKVYHDANLDQIVTPGARPIVAKVAKTCLYSTTQVLGSVPGAVLLGFTFLSTPPWEVEPWKTIATDNTPGGASIHAPLIIFQGGADTIVAPTVTRQLVTALCAKGETLTLRVLPGVGHVETGHDAVPELLQWIADRFAGKPAPSTCT